MHRHIIYIINPIAGTRTKKGLQAFIEQKTKEQGIPYALFSSAADGDYSFLYPVIKEQQTTDVVIAGGDGTVSHIISSLLHLDLNFGIIPCGSGNGLALSAKIPRQPSKALDIIFKNRSSAIDGFYINDRFSCMLCGLGFDARVAKDFAQQPKRGLMTYVRLVIKNFFAAKTHSFEIHLAGSSFTTDAYFISIANSNQYGNNFTIAPKARLDDGLLDIVIGAGQKKYSFLLQVLKQVRGRNALLQVQAIGQKASMVPHKKRLLYFQAEELTIINRSLAPLQIDGDPAITSEKVQIIIKKKCFRLLQP